MNTSWGTFTSVIPSSNVGVSDSIGYLRRMIFNNDTVVLTD